MGCDIHTYREKKVDGEWVTADEWEYEDSSLYEDENPYWHVPWKNQIYSERSYYMFGLLANVRADSGMNHIDKGLPDDACKEVKATHVRWDVDAHSASYMTLNQLKEIRKQILLTPMDKSNYIQQDLSKIITDLEQIDAEDARMVYWFDN